MASKRAAVTTTEKSRATTTTRTNNTVIAAASAATIIVQRRKACSRARHQRNCQSALSRPLVWRRFRNSQTRFGARNECEPRNRTLEHFVQDWESAFALARPFIVCPENRHYVLEDRPVFASDAVVRLPPGGFVLPKSRFCGDERGMLLVMINSSSFAITAKRISTLKLGRITHKVKSVQSQCVTSGATSAIRWALA